jgi:hypothetical protein
VTSIGDSLDTGAIPVNSTINTLSTFKTSVSLLRVATSEQQCVYDGVDQFRQARQRYSENQSMRKTVKGWEFPTKEALN